jgi:hypothetical protein
MSRLIDADDLIEYIKIWEIGNSISSDQKEFIDCINRQPTVFDVDEVVRQIKDIKDKEYTACLGPECGYCRYLSTCSYGGKADKLALEKTIEIVKGGGVDGN